MPDTWPWTDCNGIMVAEISDLQANRKLRTSFSSRQNILELPDGSTVPFCNFSRQTDGEGDTTHWTLSLDGVEYHVLND